MPSRSEITYFGAGPGPLPTDVLEDAAQALLNFDNTGLGLAEHSHRSALATKVINDAKADLAKFLDIPENYEIIFLTGGGSGEFAAMAYNFAGNWIARKQKELGEDAAALKTAVEGLKMDYIVTGGWSAKAAAEAERLFGPEHVNVAADSRKINNGKYGIIPDESTWNLSPNSAMVYLCDNETVHGVEFPQFPKRLETGSEKPIVVADMSSNILSREIPIQNYAAIFFGAQKNLGVAGITVAVVEKSFLPQPSAPTMRQLGLPIPPKVLEFETIAKNNSLYNTLSIFDVYIAGRVLKKLLNEHPEKARGQQALSEKKAELVYKTLEEYPDTYHVIPDKTARSRMNICFNITGGNAVEEEFLKQGTAKGLTGLKGHRDLKGIRVSNYNSVTLEGVEKLVEFIRAFATQGGK